MPEQGNRPLSTYARLTLSNWGVLAKLIAHYSMPIQKALEEPDSTTPFILSESQVNEALQGPFSSFLQERMSHFASLGKVRSKVITSQQEMFKRDITPDSKPDENGLTPEIVSHISLPSLDHIFQQLEQLTHDHNQQWIDANNYWKNGLSQYFTQSNMSLSEIEAKEFMTDVSATELYNQFSELKLEAPKTKQGCRTFGAYLKLKSALAVYSSLSRRLQPHAETDIMQFLKPLSNYFTDVEKYERQMLDNQNSQVNQALQAVAFALPPV